MRILLTFTLLSILPIQTTMVFAQGVRDRCPASECGVEISPWFYAFLFGAFLIITFYKLFFGNEAEHKKAFNSLFTTVRLAFLFIGIPAAAFILFGGKEGYGGGAAIISFNVVLLVFCFTEKLSKWAVGKRYSD